ncbi:MAG: hypothetical protein AAGA81_00550 [Acidobacteriota bacterium]
MARALRNTLFCLLPLLLLTGAGPAAAADTERLLEGTFRWNQGSREDKPIQAQLTQVDDDVWQATFTFRFNGSQRRWRGELQGSLDGGEVTGTVSQGRGRRPRTWRIEGSVQDGVLQASHYEQRRSGETLTGTIRLVVEE